MNWLDALIILAILACLIRGLFRGFVSEVIALAVVIFGALAARLAAPSFSHLLLNTTKWPEGTCDVIAYVLIFLAVAVLLTLLGRYINRFIRAIHLAWLNSLLGGVLGACKALLYILIICFAFERTNDAYHYMDNASFTEQSALYPTIQKVTYDLLSFSRSELGEPGTDNSESTTTD